MSTTRKSTLLHPRLSVGRSDDPARRLIDAATADDLDTILELNTPSSLRSRGGSAGIVACPNSPAPTVPSHAAAADRITGGDRGVAAFRQADVVTLVVTPARARGMGRRC